jgi:PAS domain S-box-containing protein
MIVFWPGQNTRAERRELSSGRELNRPPRMMPVPVIAVQAAFVEKLEEIGADVADALERVRVPAYVVDKHGIVRWENKAALAVFGDVRGKQITSLVAPEERLRAREIFYRNLTGPPEGSDNRGVAHNASGERITVEVSAVPLTRDHHVIGVFGQVVDIEDEPPPPSVPNLTPRQTEVLRLLERGRSTTQIANEMHLSPETIRNHIRGLMRALGAHSRLEAVVLARPEHAGVWRVSA